MRGYTETKIFWPSEMVLFHRATALVACIEEAVPEIRCHELARAVGRILELEVQDGHYGFVEHSWLWTRPLPKELREQECRLGLPHLLDVYSVGQLPMVRLLDCEATSLPHIGWSYRPSWSPRKDIRNDVVEILVQQMLTREKK